MGAAAADGIVTFPSIHAGIALILAWAAWSSTALRYPLLVLNALMAIGAVTHGAHYFVDVIAGLLVAVAVIAIADKRLAVRSSLWANPRDRLKVGVPPIRG